MEGKKSPKEMSANVTWIETVVTDGKDVLMIFLNERYDVPGFLHYKDKIYKSVSIHDYVFEHGIKRKIVVIRIDEFKDTGDAF